MLQLLTEPFLQSPRPDSIKVVWFTEFLGTSHEVRYGRDLERVIKAGSTKLSRSREDSSSKLGTVHDRLVDRSIWRHEAEVKGLIPGEKLPYRVVSHDKDRSVSSEVYRLNPLPEKNKHLNILLTSDHQLMPMTAANLQKVEETFGVIDAVFLAGDLVNIPDRASEWFDDIRGGAFFPCLQGRANYHLEKNGIATVYRGGEIIQNCPLFPAIGNHEVMGRFSDSKPLNEQFYDPIPKNIAKKIYGDDGEDLTFNVLTYQEIFRDFSSKYYAITFGDIRLVVLYITNIWRVPNLEPNARGRYYEKTEDLENPENWGYGQHIFESIKPDSEQYRWLEKELDSEEFKGAKYKVVMFHHPPHTLGSNIVPPYTDPVMTIDRDLNGKIRRVRYDYPIENDYIIRYIIPLLEKAGVNLVFYGHSHLWNRFVSPGGMNFLESSNVGNSYGAYLGDRKRVAPDDKNYIPTGNPNGLNPVVPNIDPLIDMMGKPLPYIASNDFTVFSILDTGKGTVSSYRFDTRYPDSEVIKFDEFTL